MYSGNNSSELPNADVFFWSMVCSLADECSQKAFGVSGKDIPMRSLSRWTSFFWIQLRKTSAAAFPLVRTSSISLAVCCCADV